MISLKVYQGQNEMTTINDFKAIPVEIFNEIQVLSEYSLDEAYVLLNSTPKLYTNYKLEGYGSTSVVSVSDVINFLDSIPRS